MRVRFVGGPKHNEFIDLRKFLPVFRVPLPSPTPIEFISVGPVAAASRCVYQTADYRLRDLVVMDGCRFFEYHFTADPEAELHSGDMAAQPEFAARAVKKRDFDVTR